MSQRQNAAYAAGRIAYLDGLDLTACTRRNRDQRARWQAGFEAARKERHAATVTEAEVSESTANFAALRARLSTLNSQPSTREA